MFLWTASPPSIYTVMHDQKPDVDAPPLSYVTASLDSISRERDEHF